MTLNSPPHICRTRPRPPTSAPNSGPFYPKVPTHIPGYLPLFPNPPHALHCSLPVSREHPSIAFLLPLNRPASAHPSWSSSTTPGPHPGSPQSGVPPRLPPTQAGPAAQGGRWEAAEQGRRLRFLPPHISPSRRDGRRQYLSLRGSSGPLSGAGSAGRAGEGVGSAGRKRGGGDSGRGPGVGRSAAAAPPLIEPIGAPRPGARRGGRAQAAEMVEGVEWS